MSGNHDHHTDEHGYQDPPPHQAPWVTALTICIVFGVTITLLFLKSLGKA